MLLNPLTITLLAFMSLFAVASMLLAFRYRAHAIAAKGITKVVQKEADTAICALESAKIHGCIDRTRRKQVELVFDVLCDAILVIDTHGEVLHINQAANCLINIPSSEAVGRPLSEVVTDHQLLSTILNATTGLPREGRLYEQEISVDLEKVAYEVHLNDVGNSTNSHHAVVAVLRDLSREREIARLKSDFVSKASHELRTPLSSISAYVEMLVDGDASDEKTRQDFYSVISTETKRLQRMIDNLLNISRIEAGLMHIDRKTCEFKLLVERAVKNMTPQAQSKELSIHSQLPSADLFINADEDMLYQVIVNLLSNAIKYTPNGGRITLTADIDNLTRSLHFSVSDTGLGIAPNQMDKVFDKFYRVENYRRVAKGTGLGLNLCQHIIETLHSGTIGLESNLGMGSKFWFTIPSGGEITKNAA